MLEIFTIAETVIWICSIVWFLYSVEQSGKCGEGRTWHAVPCVCMMWNLEAASGLLSCPSCLWLMLCTVDAGVLNGFKMFCLDLGRFVFVSWCAWGSSSIGGFSEEKLGREWVC